MPVRRALFSDAVAADALEAAICEKLAAFFSFGSHTHYFARGDIAGPEWLPAENRLLLPLLTNGGATLVLRLDSVCADLLPILHHLPALLSICMENVELAERGRRDPVTGLPDEGAFLAEISQRIDAFHNGERRPTFGILTLVWPGMPEPALGAEADAIADLRPKLVTCLNRCLPQDALCYHIGGLAGYFGFGIIFDAPGRAACQWLAMELIAAFGRFSFRDRLTHELAPVRFYGGHAFYPHDMQGADLFRAPGRQAIILRERALLAGRLAFQTGSKPAMAWSWIPAQACVVEECRGHGILRITPGHAANIRVGQRFDVLGEDGASKGGIIVRETRENDAFCEILHVERAGEQPMPGDRLRIDNASLAQSQAGLLPERSWFFRRLAELTQRAPQFCVGITRLQMGQAASDDSFGQAFASFVKNALAGPLDGVLAARYGRDGLITFIPGDQACVAAYRRLHECADASGLAATTGIFAYPCLNIGKDASETCALKALEYAALLPEPRIGFLDGLALAISGDKLFSQGEELAALEEYRLALLLRPDDAAILNALAVCLASLHRPGEARARFLEALEKCQDRKLRAKICYNLGNLSQKENDLHAARAHYRACIRLDPEHVYAWTRVAQIANLAGKPKNSVSLYRHAARLARFNPDALNMIARQLARVEAGRSQTDRAREILHDSLLRNPDDQASLLELARTYIGDEPAMAELLARKCLNLGGKACDVLIDALNAQGRTEEAARVAAGRS